jgi:hypothetical protein
MRIEVLSWQEALRNIGADWSALVRSSGANPSLDPRWMDAVLRSHARTGEAFVAAAHEGDALVGALPFLETRVRLRGLSLNAVDLASNLVSYHPEIVGTRPTELLEATLAHAHAGRWDLLRIDNAPDDAATVQALRAVAARLRAKTLTRPGESSPYIAIDSGWDEFLATRSKKFRANVTRAVRRMKEQGETAMQWFGPGDDAAALLRCMLEIEERSWKADAGSAITDRRVEIEYYRCVLPVLSEMGALFANVLFIKDVPAAYVLCCNYDGWVGQLKTSFDKSIQDAGARVIDESVRSAFASGARTYDFLGEASAHKLKWTDRVRTHHGYWLLSRRPLARLAWWANACADKLRSMRRPKSPSSTAPPADTSAD